MHVKYVMCVLYGMLCEGMGWHGMVGRMVWYGTLWYRTVQVWFGMV